MANTNLYQSSQLPGSAPRKGITLDKGMIFSGVLLILALAAFGGVNWYKSTLESKKSELAKEITAESEMLRSSDADRVADFQKRLVKIDENLATKKNPADILDRLEQTVIPEVVITALNVDSQKGTLELKLRVDNFSSMARQILIFKQEGLLMDASFTEVGRDPEGGINFTASGKLPNTDEGDSNDADQ